MVESKQNTDGSYLIGEDTTRTLCYSKGQLFFLDNNHGLYEPKYFSFNPLLSRYEAPAYMYKDIMVYAMKNKLSICDHAKDYTLDKKFELKEKIIPRSFQARSIEAWKTNNYLGVVSLPTGAGKTIVAVLGINILKRPTLVVVPTLDLVKQWVEKLEFYFKTRIGVLGGGYKRVEDITVSTYDSAFLYSEYLGNKFGLLVFDECHHLAASSYLKIALNSIAPFRLGISATVERSDGGEQLIYKYVGPSVYQAGYDEVSGYLSSYRVESLYFPLTEEDQLSYDRARKVYLDFLKSSRIDFSSGWWSKFIIQSSYSDKGRQALECYWLQKRIAQRNEKKLEFLWKLLLFHKDDQMIIFTDDNDFAYEIASRFYLACITHITPKKERAMVLDMFRQKKIQAIVTSKVLNEGVDVPSVRVGVVVSGSAAVREHVQRLGRILRPSSGKKEAVLYELISKNTSECSVNQRRRDHYAYKRSGKI